MAASKPLWRKGVEAVDKVAAPVVEGATQHEAFGLVVGLVRHVQSGVGMRAERLSRHVLHTLNLPTASDVHRLLSHITAVENRLRTLTAYLEDLSAAPESPARPGATDAVHRPSGGETRVRRSRGTEER